MLQSPAEWTQFRANPQHNAVLPGALEVQWRVETGAPFSSSPALAGGMLYIGNNAGSLYALSAATGRLRWRYTARASLMSNPLVYRGLVIAGEGNQISYKDPRDPSRLLVGTAANAILALDAATGRLRWRTRVRGSAMPTGAILGGVLYEHNGAGMLVAIDPLHGRVLYRRDLRSVSSMSAALPVAGVIVSTGSDRNAALGIDPQSGRIRWSVPLPGDASGSGDCPPAAYGTLVFCTYLTPVPGDRNTELQQPAYQHVYAVDARSGALRWQVQTERGPLPRYNEAAIPLVDGNTLFVGSAVGPWMHALDARTGRLRWRTPLHGVVKGGIAALDGVLYFGDYAGYLYAMDERTGRVIGTLHFDTPFNVGSPLIAGRTLIIGSYSGSVIAVPLRAIRAGGRPQPQ